MVIIKESEGPYPLTAKSIDENVKETIGNYFLGIAAKGIFVVKYVGRSDTNLNGRLKDYLGDSYSHFKFSYTANPVNAYYQECRDYHRFIDAGKKLDNEIHPDKPNNSPNSLVCPICGQ